MALFSNGWAAGLALALLFLAGCKTAGPAPNAADASNASGKPRTQARGESVDAATARLAQAHAHYGAALIHEMNGEASEALDDFLEAARMDAGNEDLTLEVTRRCLEGRQPGKALMLLTNITAQATASGDIYGQLGLIYWQLGETNLAQEANKTAVKKSPRSLAGYRNLFLVYEQNKQYAEARQVLDQALKQSGTDAGFLVDLAGLLLAQDRHASSKPQESRSSALAALNRAAQLNPTDPELRLRLADGLNALGESDKALPIYQDLLRQFPDSAVMRTGLRAKVLDIYLRGQDHSRASEQLEAMLRDDPSNVQAYYLLGRLAREDKKPDKAAEYFAKALLFAPDFEPAYYELAQAQLSQDKGSEALATATRARAKFGDSYAVHLLSALAQQRMKHYAEAIESLNAAEVMARATDTNQLSDLYFQFGVTYERKGDVEQAAKYFEKTIALAPDFAEALNYLGYMWADRGENLDRARELIEKAVKLEPKNGAFLDSLGWVLFKQGQPEKALGYLRQAIEVIEAPDPTLFDHLGDIYAALHQPDKAREAWSKSLSLEPNEKIQHKLGPAPAK